MSQAIAVAITGASGVQYGLRLIECLLKAGQQVQVMLTQAGQVVINMETDLRLSGGAKEMQAQLVEHFACDPNQLAVFGRQQWTAPVASGTNPPRAMVICPCTTGTLASVAAGVCDDLIDRAADVALKERRKLIIVLRETPLTNIHLQNMLTLSQAGAVIMPANPGFYFRPQSVDEIIDFMVARVLDHLEVEHDLSARWGEPDQA